MKPADELIREGDTFAAHPQAFDGFEIKDWMLANWADLREHLKWADEDQPIVEDIAIEAAHPLITDRHDLYVEAMRMVGAKRSKFALVALVNWLLYERAKLSEKSPA